MRKVVMAAVLLSSLAACQRSEAPGNLTSEESNQLDDAAAMLDNADAVAVSEDATANGADATVSDDGAAH